MKALLLLAAVTLAAAPAQDTFKRERGGPNDATKNSWEGKAPPALEAESWKNTPGDKPLEWKSLRGKVVLIDMWAYW